MPQGLKAESFRFVVYGLKPVPTSPYLPIRANKPAAILQCYPEVLYSEHFLVQEALPVRQTAGRVSSKFYRSGVEGIRVRFRV
jgi:hypothetical protein